MVVMMNDQTTLATAIVIAIATLALSLSPCRRFLPRSQVFVSFSIVLMHTKELRKHRTNNKKFHELKKSH